jgi:hypothetical protein
MGGLLGLKSNDVQIVAHLDTQGMFMVASQVWELRFSLPLVKLDAERTFNKDGRDLTLVPVNTDSSEGRLLFTVEGDAIDEKKAKAAGQAWIDRNLVDPYLVAFGESLRFEISDLILINESKLKLLPRTNYSEMGITAVLRRSLAVSDVERSLELGERLRRHPERQSLERSLRWFRKANDSDEVVDVFMTLWVAFNAFYGMFDPRKRGDMTAIQNLFNKHPSTGKIDEMLAAHKTATAMLASRNLTNWHRTTNYSEQLAASLEDGRDARSTLRKIGFCLRAVRNEVFHGGAKPGREIDFLRECNSLLKTIYRECFCDYL